MTDESGALERNLGFTEAMTLGGGTMIGAGIFILPGIAAKGAGPASSISFAIAGFVALLAALSLSELATGMPIAGGSYHYVNRGLGSLFGSIVGWGMWTGLMFASAFYMVGFGQYIVEPLPFFDGRTLIVAFGILGLGLILGINYYGTEESSGAQNLMIGTEFAIVMAYTLLGVFFIDGSNLAEFAPRGPSGVLETTGTVFVTFLGFEIIATVAGEVKKPGKNIPLTMVLSVVSVTVLYMIIMVVSTGVVPWQQLGGSLVPVSDVADVILGTVGVAAIVFAAVIAAISSSNSSVLAASRVIFAMGRDNLMTNWLNVTHDRFNTPHRAILTTGAVTTLLIALGLEVGEIVALLAEVASFSFLVSYALVHLSLVSFRRANPPEYDPDFVLPDLLYPAVPVAGVLMTVFVIYQMETLVQLVGIGIVVLGLIWYLVYVYAQGRDVESGLLLDTFREPDRPYRVAVPVANPETQRGLLQLAAATARIHADDGTPQLVAINVVEGESSPDTNVDAGRLTSQRELLAAADEVAEDIGIDLQTRAVVAPDTGQAIVDVAEEAEAAQLLLGWDGELARGEYVFGRTIDPAIREASCEVSLVSVETEIGQPVALAGPGPHAPVAARRAAEFAAVADETPVLLNVQSPDGDDPVARGQDAIDWIADRADLAPDEYESEVVVSDDTEAAIVDAVAEYDTVCVGLSEKSETERVLFGSIAERISRAAPGNVGIIRGELERIVDGQPGDRDVTSAD